jgi:hypothetical protein
MHKKVILTILASLFLDLTISTSLSTESKPAETCTPVKEHREHMKLG